MMLKPISHVLLFLTYRCNLRCDFCLSFNRFWRADPSLPLPAVEPQQLLRRARGVREMSTCDVVERVIPQCEENGVEVIALSGGEVLVRRDATKIFRALGASKMRWCMDSNLMLCNETIADAVVDSRCDTVFVSLDGTRHIHNRLRGNPKAFEKTMEGLQNLIEARQTAREHRTTIKINFLLQPGNEAEPIKMVDLAKKCLAEEIDFQLLSDREYRVPLDTKTAVSSLRAALTMAEKRGLRANVYPLPSPDEDSLRAWYSSPLTDRFYGGCSYIYKNLRIDPEGNVIPCLEHKLGNILKQNLSEILSGEPYRIFRRSLSRDGPFEACLRCCNMDVYHRQGSGQRKRCKEQNNQPIKVLQVSKNSGRDCGIDLFAEKLQTNLRRIGVDIVTVTDLQPDARADIVLLQHHKDLFSDDEVVLLTEASPDPVVLFAHSEVTGGVIRHFNGLVSMCPGMFTPNDNTAHLFPHPAWTPPSLEDRTALRREFGLPENRLIVGTNGFLKFERQFVEVVEALLPVARRNDWFVELVTSPWRLDSPGLIPKLESLHNEAPDHFRFEHTFLNTAMLNRCLQACDLLWCWTEAPSSPYASGVISDQYASGTRVFAADKQQHRHVLGLPNTVAGPDRLVPFVDGLIAELHFGDHQRHDPAPVSWDNCIHDFVAFLRTVAEPANVR